MRLFFDLDQQAFVVAPGTTQVLTSIDVKRSPNALIEVQFIRKTPTLTAVELPSGATGIFEVKETGKYDANSIFRAGSWVKTGTGADTIYTFTMDVMTPAGDLILGVEDPVTFTTAFATDDFNATAHGLVLNDIVQFSTSADDLSDPLLTNRDYHVISAGLTANSFRVSTTEGGTAVNLTDNGTGTHQFRKVGDDEARVVLMAAMQYVASGNTVESQTFIFNYINDVVRDGDSSPPADPEDVIVAVRSGKDLITNGTDAGTVTFSSAFAGGTVVPTVSVGIPSGGDNIFAVVDESTVTTAGFNYKLSSTVPAAGYKLNYIAVAV